MKKYVVLIVGVFVLASARTAIAVPVVPNFTQGSMTSNTETTSTVTETINSMNYIQGINTLLQVQIYNTMEILFHHHQQLEIVIH